MAAAKSNSYSTTGMATYLGANAAFSHHMDVSHDLVYDSLLSDGDERNTNVIDDTYRTSNVVATQSETEPLMHAEPNGLSYGTNEEVDEESGAFSGSSEELYDQKLCVICYDEQRNSFFVPCGHCATCYDCAGRILWTGKANCVPYAEGLFTKYEDYFIVRLVNL